MTNITIDLDEKHAALLAELKGRAGAEASDVVGLALEMLADATLFGEDQPPLTEEQRKAIEEGLAAIERGDVVSHEEVAARMRAKFGE